jgi:hypothetical protein
VLVVRLAVAACVLLVLAACGTGRASEEAPSSLESPSLSAAAERSEYQAARGVVTRPIWDDVTLAVSAPTSFTPTDEAYPKAARAVAFELVIDNRSDTVYRPEQLSFVATADGMAVDQVIDTTQGYSGVIGTADELQPSQTARFSIAFGVPDQPCVVRVAVRPDSSSASAIPIFDGTV